MRLISLLALVIYLVPSLFILAARIPHNARKGIEKVVVLEVRQESTGTTTTADDSDSTITSATGTATATGTSSSNSTSNTTRPATTTIASLNTSTASSSKETSSVKPGELPLKPRITPALGLGGFILMALGVILALIGIRRLWVQCFLSTAFLTSLGVTVLIVYVMNPPVRIAIQGAYLVAIFFTGVTSGALSIVFKELTEGLGCLLGGFCCSMWLLALKPGGLLTSTDAKSGFIGAISVAFYALSFSHYTRPYGLIVGTAISGGTAVALGIDCFSRAGLKEYWLYIWALNDDIFPLETNTYPVTRNIRVELAVTVIIAILGVVSQLRLWKVIRERRRSEDKKREEEQREKDEAETEAGRRLEKNNIRERSEWEATYGGNKPPSNIAELTDETKKRPGDLETDLEKRQEVEVASVENSQKSYRCSECREREANGDLDSDASGAEATHDYQEAHEVPEGHNPDQIQDGETPIPFKVFDGAAAAKVERDDESDVTAIVGSDTGTIRSKRYSGMSMLRRMSVRSSVRPTAQSQEAFVAREGDSNSSAQGNHDEASEQGSAESAPNHDVQGRDETKDHEAQETSHEEIPTVVADGEKAANVNDDAEKEEVHEDKKNVDQEGSPKPDPATQKSEPAGKKDSRVKNLAANFELKDGKSGKQPEPKQPKQGNPDPPKKDAPQEPPETQSPAQASPVQAESKSSDKKPVEPKRASTKSSSKSSSKPKKEEPVTLNAETVKHIPERTSRIVQSYRTNEWAKHLSDAEVPEPDPIQPVEEDQTEHPEEPEEPTAPINIKELLQTPLTAQPPPIQNRVPQSQEPSSPNEERRKTNASPLTLTDILRSNSMRDTRPDMVRSSTQLSGDSLPNLNRAQSSQALHPHPFIPQTGQQPPVGEATPKSKWKGPPALLSVREDMMKNRVLSTSLSTDPYFSRNNPRQFPEISPTSPTFTTPEEADDLPLSQRRAMLQQTSPIQPAKSPPPRPIQRATSPVNPHAVMAAWRESVREDLTQRRGPLGIQGQRSPEGVASPLAQAQRESSMMIENAIAEGMQRGDMSDLHREAMRRMQASAYRRGT